MLVFDALATVAVLGALGLILFKNPVHSALSLLLTFFAMAGIYVLLDAPVLAVFQIAVYAGAVMVLFIFVVMFLNLDTELGQQRHEWLRAVAIMLGAGLALAISVWGLSYVQGPQAVSLPVDQARALGRLLFSDYVVPFEAISLLLVAAAIGAVAINRKRHS